MKLPSEYDRILTHIQEVFYVQEVFGNLPWTVSEYRS